MIIIQLNLTQQYYDHLCFITTLLLAVFAQVMNNHVDLTTPCINQVLHLQRRSLQVWTCVPEQAQESCEFLMQKVPLSHEAPEQAVPKEGWCDLQNHRTH